jgi:hypothetical protein
MANVKRDTRSERHWPEVSQHERTKQLLDINPGLGTMKLTKSTKIKLYKSSSKVTNLMSDEGDLAPTVRRNLSRRKPDKWLYTKVCGSLVSFQISQISPLSSFLEIASFRPELVKNVIHGGRIRGCL